MAESGNLVPRLLTERRGEMNSRLEAIDTRLYGPPQRLDANTREARGESVLRRYAAAPAATRRAAIEERLAALENRI